MHFTVHIKVSLVIAFTFSGQDGGDRLRVLAIGQRFTFSGPYVEPNKRAGTVPAGNFRNDLRESRPKERPEIERLDLLQRELVQPLSGNRKAVKV